MTKTQFLFHNKWEIGNALKHHCQRIKSIKLKSWKFDEPLQRSTSHGSWENM